MKRVGCSGWSYPHWRGVVYPLQGSTTHWLSRYAEALDTVEVNATFYRLPRVEVVERWATVTGQEFCFAVKASRYATHIRRLRDVSDAAARLEERVAPLRKASKLGPVLWQLPGNFARDDERLAAVLRALPEGRHAFEFRHPSWFDPKVYALLARRRVALVAADRAPAPPSPWVETTSWAYVRFHAGRGRAGNYTDAQIREWAGRIAEAPGDVYAYFNNDWQGFAFRNACRLRELVEG
jgi:uncharacterized protein YecE (DUF72 family)